MSKVLNIFLDNEIADVKMPMDLNYWFQRTPFARHQQYPQITCKDGFQLSVQVGKFYYCAPRANTGPWSKVEVGFPSMAPELIQEWAEDPENLTDTVYVNVPIELVQQLIDLHGGIDE